MPKFNTEKNNICQEKLYCYKHQKCNKCNLHCKNQNNRVKVIMYLLCLMSVYNIQNNKYVKEKIQKIKKSDIYIQENITNESKNFILECKVE